jgi:replicative DNA helicase
MNDDNGLRIPPHSIECEQGILGALLLDNGAWDRLPSNLKPEHFYSHANNTIFIIIGELLAKKSPVDVITVFEALSSARKIDEVGGIGYLNNLAQYVPSAANLRRYADVVIERYKSRQLLTVSAEVASLADNQTMTINERIDLAQAQLGKLVGEEKTEEWVGAYEAMVQHTEVIERRANGEDSAMPTGLIDLDHFLEGGLREGELHIIAARPSQGKTAIAMTIGLHMAQDYSVAMLSMEMPHREVRDRMTAMLGRVSLSTVKRPNRDFDWGRVVDGTQKAQNLNFYVSDMGGLNINQVRTKARTIKRLHGLNVLIVDYIGLMTGLDSKMARVYQLGEVSRGLKQLAKELNIAVVCLAQVNRKADERQDSSPSLSDLRDSGDIEQDADVVTFVQRPIQSKPELGADFEHYAKITVAKNRNGRCGVLSLFYQGDQTRFDAWHGQPPSIGAISGKRGMQ